MSDDIAIKVENLTKIYKLYNSSVDRLKEALSPIRRKYHHDFHALHDVSFEIRKGESVGIIGKNGSGKSTLLKILTGVLTPTSGTVQVDGNLSALLELGAGFNPELTGIENVYYNGMLLGYTREEMDARRDDILSFADIGEFVYQPVKTYSSGMFVRLAFSVAVQVEPEILFVDEALSVGDVFFQQKCIRKITAFQNAGGTTIFVSHDMNAVKSLCSRSILMHCGSIVEFGSAAEMSDLYSSMILKEELSNSSDIDLVRQGGAESGGTVGIDAGAVIIRSVHLTNEAGTEIDSVTSETNICLTFTLDVVKDIDEPLYGFHVRNKYGVSVFDTQTACMGVNASPVHAGDSVKVVFRFNCNLFPDNYSISFGCCNRPVGINSFEEALLWQHDLKILKVLKNMTSIEYAGVFNLRPTVEILHDRTDSGM
jgi:lipopolysaccharide transport system ATP-binding protein